MQIRMLVQYRPVTGQWLEAGAVVEMDDATAVDLIQRRLAEPVRTAAEHAVGPGQAVRLDGG